MKANREDVVCTLLAARCLISDKNSWSQRANARTAFGRIVDAADKAAASWCAMGALHAVAPTIAVRNAALHALGAAAYPLSTLAINDELAHGRTLDLFDRAIELAAA